MTTLLIRRALLPADALSPGRPEWTWRGFLMSVMNCLYKTIFQACNKNLTSSVSRETRTNMQSFCVSDECALQDHHLGKPIILTQCALSPGRPEWTCRGFPVLVMNTHYKNIFQISLSYQLNELCLHRDLNNECEEASLVSPMNGLFKTTFWIKLSPQRLCLQENLNKDHEGSSPVSFRNSLFKTNF